MDLNTLVMVIVVPTVVTFMFCYMDWQSTKLQKRVKQLEEAMETAIQGRHNHLDMIAHLESLTRKIVNDLTSLGAVAKHVPLLRNDVDVAVGDIQDLQDYVEKRVTQIQEEMKNLTTTHF